MLTALHIQNFAIVKELTLDFHEGMTAFTGETGAGKSIMIDALMLALGGRAEASVVRAGAEKCDITAHFTFSRDTTPDAWLIEQDIPCEEGELIVRRVLYAEGRSKSWINGHPFPLQKLRELGELLVHIHGQHQHQTLMHHNMHRIQLDHYANHKPLLLQVQEQYQHCQKIKQEIDRLSNKDKQQDKQALLAFQLQELSVLAIEQDEMQRLHEEHQMLHHAKDYLVSMQQIETLIQGEDNHSAITSGLHQVLQEIGQLPEEHAPIKNARELINSALIQCEEAWSEIQAFSEQVQLDPERLQAVETRIGVLHAMGRKYQVDAGQLPHLVARLDQELQDIKAVEVRVAALQKDYAQAMQQYEQAALQLRESRKKEAIKLAEDITVRIRQLGMPKGYMLIELTPLDKMQVHGLDKVEYKVCTNPGMLPDTLGKIASGGELSRISLAIQLITAQRGETPTLLFDEVDVGIGGATAALVGKMLRDLGERLQVFCVTHQPQVAACAHHHFVVFKFSDNAHTWSNVLPLTLEADKVDEIARMLGGLTITEQTRSHARELLLQY